MANPVTYAEVQLGVHEVFKYAEVLHDELVNCQLNLEEAQRNRRDETENLSVVEAAYIARMRGSNPDLSQTAFEKQIKLWMASSPDLVPVRRKLATAVDSVLFCEHSLRAVEMKLKIQIARMNELGGYLQYLAAAKIATLTTVHAPLGT